MKNTIKVILITFVCIFSSCKKEDITTTLSITPESLTVDYLGGISTFTVTTTASSFTCSSSKDWCVVTVNGKIITATIAENTSGESRTANIRIKANDETLNVNVTQGVFTAMLADSVALLKFKALSTNINWTLTAPMDTWDGVKIAKIGESRRVVELDLHGKSLLGTIPTEIKSLTELAYLDLSNNALSGEIPDLSTLTKLVVLDLSINKLTGNLPANISTIKTLAYLSIGQNKLTGSLPPEYSALTSLNVLDLGMNQFTDNIPASWSALTKLRYFYLYGNTLGGTIPTYLSTFSKLINLSLEYNNLTGNIPTGIGSIITLKDLTMGKNRLSGAVPSDLVTNSHWDMWKAEIMNQQTAYVLTLPSPVSAMSKVQSVVSTYQPLAPRVLPDKKLFLKK